ncbi:MAG: DUF4157 domain-containing protein [Myxococcota bacterium]
MHDTTARDGTPTSDQPRAASSPSRGQTARVQLRTSLRAASYEEGAAALAPARDDGDVQALAAEGVRGGGGALPHRDAIQRSFGRHDVGGVSAHVGGQGAAAAGAMGAEAYATGDRIAFRGEPDLHTAAHEAAHVVQQRAGAAPSGGVGREGDALEQEADRVADLVVAGKSAEGELGAPASGASGAAGGVVQRRLIHPEVMGDLDASEKVPKELTRQIAQQSLRGGLHEQLVIETSKLGGRGMEPSQRMMNRGFGEDDRRTEGEVETAGKRLEKVEKKIPKLETKLSELPPPVKTKSDAMKAGIITFEEESDWDDFVEESKGEDKAIALIAEQVENQRTSYTEQLEGLRQEREQLLKEPKEAKPYLGHDELQEKVGGMGAPEAAQVSERLNGQYKERDVVAPKRVGYHVAVDGGVVQDTPAKAFWEKIVERAKGALASALSQDDAMWDIFGTHDVDRRAGILGDVKSDLGKASGALDGVKRITIDASGVTGQTGAQGWTDHASGHVFLIAKDLSAPSDKEVETLCHESMHLVAEAITDDLGYADAADGRFWHSEPEAKLKNADHFAMVVRVAMGGTAPKAPYRPLPKVVAEEKPKGGSGGPGKEGGSDEPPVFDLEKATTDMMDERRGWSRKLFGRSEQALSKLATLATQKVIDERAHLQLRNLHRAFGLPQHEGFLAGLPTLPEHERATYMSAIVPLAEQFARRLSFFTKELDHLPPTAFGAEDQLRKHKDPKTVALEVFRAAFEESKLLLPEDKKPAADMRVDWLVHAAFRSTLIG